MEDRIFYVAYGSNLDGFIMNRRCPDSFMIGKGKLKNFRLMFKGEVPYSYATVEEWEGYDVPVVLYGISEDDERRLDRYEGVPVAYEKRQATIELDDELVTGKKNVTGLIYVKHDDERLNPPPMHYYAVIYEAYEKLGFDTAILEDALKFSDRRF